MTLTLDIEHDDTTSTLRILGPDELGDANTPSLQSARIERQLTRQPDATDTAEVVVYRDAWSDVEQSLDRTNDRLVIREDGAPEFGGRLADFERDGVVVSVLIDSPKRDAIDAEPSGGNDVYQPQPDSALVENELLPRVPTVGAGTLETVDNAIAFSESHASPGKSLTKLARDADAELRYRTTETGFVLDYLGRLGADRTDETLSPASATVLGEPRIREQITEDVTHVRVLGAGEGTAQVEATAVASGFDPANDRAVWRSRTDKDIQQAERAQSLAQTLVAEYDGAPEFIEVEFEVPRSVNPSLGDTFTVEIPAHDINETLRIIMLERLIDDAGDRFRTILSNRRHTADTGGDERALELDSLSEGNAGQVVRDSDSQGFDKVDSGEPQEWFFDYPSDVIGEFEAKLRVESQPFRRPASAQGHSHAFSVPSHAHNVSISDTTTSGNNSDFTATADAETSTGQSVTVSTDTQLAAFEQQINGSRTTVQIFYRKNTADVGEVTFKLREQNEDGFLDQVTTTVFGDEDHTTVYLTVEKDMNGSDLEVVASDARFGDGDHDATYFARWKVVGKHTHDVSLSDTATTSSGGSTSSTTDSETSLEPGIVTESTLTPSNVSVDIDGETVVSGLDHPIQETVDISGVLSAGANQITASSDTLGELRTSVTFEAVKNVGDTQ